MKKLPDNSVDAIFADPPYNLQLHNELLRPNQKKYEGVEDDWDKFSSTDDYDEFSGQWLTECRRLLKDTGTIWVIGSYHNIFRIGTIMQDLGFWILNDIIWTKTNPTPNFRGSRFTNAHETILWAKKSKEQTKYTFNYKAMKNYNDGKQMRSDWHIPICSGKERIKIDGSKAHSTQKPEALLRRIILSSTNVGDIVLDPFFGTGTTGAVAKKLRREWIGIERDQLYVDLAIERLDSITQGEDEKLLKTYSKRNLPSVSVANLIEVNMLKVGDNLVDSASKHKVTIKADGTITDGKHTGSIHKMGAMLQKAKTCNGWTFWYVNGKKKKISLDTIRDEYRREHLGLDLEIILD